MSGERAERTERLIRCDLCGGSSLSSFREAPSLYGKGVLRFDRCGDCGLILQNPRIPEAEGLEAYSRSAMDHPADAPGILEHYLEGTAKATGLGRGARVLDVGCGEGLLLDLARRLCGWEGEGIDLSRGLIEKGRRERGLDLRCGDWRNLDPESSAPFDLAAFIQTLEHLYHPGEALSAARKMLRPGGYLLVNVPQDSALNRRLVPRFWDDAHLYYFTGKTLDRYAVGAGFAPLTSLPSPSPGGLKRAALRLLNMAGIPAGVLTRIYRRAEPSPSGPAGRS